MSIVREPFNGGCIYFCNHCGLVIVRKDYATDLLEPPDTVQQIQDMDNHELDCEIDALEEQEDELNFAYMNS